MVRLGVRRLPIVKEERRYHLFDDQGQIVLVADYRSPWLVHDTYHHVRLARPDGKLTATVDMTAADRTGRDSGYAIIYDYAVYAILNRIVPDEASPPYYTIEAERQRWLALAHNGDAMAYALYDRAPLRLGAYAVPEPSDLSEPVGFLRQEAEGYDYAFTVSVESLRQVELVCLALVFLIDNG